MEQLSGMSSLTPTTVMDLSTPFSFRVNVLPTALSVPKSFPAVLRFTIAVAP